MAEEPAFRGDLSDICSLLVAIAYLDSLFNPRGDIFLYVGIHVRAALVRRVVGFYDTGEPFPIRAEPVEGIRAFLRLVSVCALEVVDVDAQQPPSIVPRFPYFIVDPLAAPTSGYL